MIKTVFFDIDGTLLNWQGELPKSTKKAVLRLKENGIVPVIASARPPFNFQSLMEELGIASYVALNGGLVVYENEIIHQNVISELIVQDVRELVYNRKEALVVCTSTGFEIISPNPEEMFQTYLRKWDRSKECTGRCHGDVSQLEVFCPPHSIHQYIDKHHLDFYPWGSRGDAFNVVNKGVSKAYGIEKLLEIVHQDTSEAAAFGDGINDIEMITSVGTGVAMGNAVEELKDKANLITSHVDEGGIAYGLRRLGLV